MKKNQLMSIAQKYVFFSYIVSFIVLILFLLLGIMLTLLFLLSFFTGFKGVGIMQILFFFIGIYLIYKPAMHINFLIQNKKNFNEIYNEFVKENEKAIYLTTILSVILLFLFYTNIHLRFDFFVNAVLYLPIFLLNNLVFIVNIFISRYKLSFLNFFIDLILPISEVIFLYVVSKFVVKFLNKDKGKQKK